MQVLLSGLVGALLGGMLSAYFQFWKFNRDELTSRLDDLCKCAIEAAAAASAYWAKGYAATDLEAQLTAEASIQGRQILLDGLYADVRGFMRKEDFGAIDVAMSALVDALTGGQFTEAQRPSDKHRIVMAQLAASNLVVALRRAHRRTMPLSKLFSTVRENDRRELDMPMGWPRH